MNTKIIIEVKGGSIIAVHSTKDIDYAIVDYDNVPNGSPAFNGSIYEQDSLFKSGEAHLQFINESDPSEMEVHDELKRIKF